jgi:hypothetical protein
MSKVLAIKIEAPDAVSEQSLKAAEAAARQTAVIVLQQRGELTVREAAAELGLTYEQYLQLLAERELGISRFEQDPAVITRIAESVSESANRGEEMARILEQLAALNAFADVPDPASWQREIRQDRSLHG